MNYQPAFPTVDANREEDYGTRGMTLRDYFAAKAMQGLLANNCIIDTIHEGNLEVISGHAYNFADAMMKARERYL